MWIDISKAWQAAFKEGWKSFRNGSIPIGAAITMKTATSSVQEETAPQR